MMNIRTIWVIAAFFLIAGQVQADSIVEPLGEPQITNSWSELWAMPGNTTKLEAFIIDDIGSEPIDFESPGIVINPVNDWTINLINPDYTLATGTAIGGTPTLWTYFTGTKTNQSFKIDFLAYDESGLWGYGRWIWDGTEFLQGTWEARDYDRSPIPEPTSLLLLGTGLGFMGLAVYRRRRK